MRTVEAGASNCVTNSYRSSLRPRRGTVRGRTGKQPDRRQPPRRRGKHSLFHPRIKEAFLVEMLEIGPHVADENEGGCHEATHFCIDRGALRRALSDSTGTTRDAKLSRGARERVQV